MKHKIGTKIKYKEFIMEEEYQIKSILIRTFFSIVFCLVIFVMKFVLKEENFVEEVYNYLASDIVFLK